MGVQLSGSKEMTELVTMQRISRTRGFTDEETNMLTSKQFTEALSINGEIYVRSSEFEFLYDVNDILITQT